MDESISPEKLIAARGAAAAPLPIDVRREAAFLAALDMAAGALRRDPATVETWVDELPVAAHIAVYCVHGLEEGLRTAGGDLMTKPLAAATRWVTREWPSLT